MNQPYTGAAASAASTGEPAVATAELRVCPTKTPEPHLLGEFPMTCHRCHMEADS